MCWLSVIENDISLECVVSCLTKTSPSFLSVKIEPKGEQVSEQDNRMPRENPLICEFPSLAYLAFCLVVPETKKDFSLLVNRVQ